MNPNRKFCELAGIHLHQWKYWSDDGGTDGFRCECGEGISVSTHTFHADDYGIPDYAADPVEVLRVLDEKGLLVAFLMDRCSDLDIYEVYCLFLKDQTGKLRDAAIEWMEAHTS
jgi:hypothetical protein